MPACPLVPELLLLEEVPELLVPEVPVPDVEVLVLPDVLLEFVLLLVVGLGPRESVIWMLLPFSTEPEDGYWRMTEPSATVLEYSEVVRTTVRPAF